MAVSPRDVDVRGSGAAVRPQVLGIATSASRDFAGSTLRGRSVAPAGPPASAPGVPQGRWPQGGPLDDGHGAQDEGEGEGFLEQEVLSTEERRWALVILLSSSFDLLASACLCGVAFHYAYRDEGVSLYCLGVQAVSHLVSSLVLTMRFMGEFLPAREDDGAVSDACLLVEQRRRDLLREQAAALFMGISMMVSSAGLLFKAFRKIKYWDTWYLDHTEQDQEIAQIADLMAWWGFGGYTFQALLRLLAARRLRRSIAWHGFGVSAVSLVFFFVLGLAASYQREWSWKAEPVAAIALVVVMLCEGIRTIVVHLGDVELTLGLDPRA